MTWQPIATAPTDGTDIDVWAVNEAGNGQRICDVSWSLMSDWAGDEYYGWTGMYPRHFGGKYEPTHWMPLPTPPETAQERTGA